MRLALPRAPSLAAVGAGAARRAPLAAARLASAAPAAPSALRRPAAAAPRGRAAPAAPRASAGAAAAAAAATPDAPKAPASALTVSAYIGGWYAFNIVFNLLNKSLLNVFPAPWLIATLQLVASAAFMAALWASGAQPAPRVTPRLLRALAPIAAFHTLGHVAACVSFSQMAVSFAHVVKSAEPVLSVVLARAVLGEANPWYVWASLAPIVGGCSLAAMKEVSFSWAGFNNAMLSNVGMVARNIYSKKSLQDFTDARLDGINLFGLLSILSVAICAPLALAVEGLAPGGGGLVWPAMARSAADAMGGYAPLLRLGAATGLFYHLYNQASYMVLGQGISPVTFSVGNTMKRVAVVASSVVFFRNPVSALNWAGSLMALLGTGLYSAAKQRAAAEAGARAKAT